MVFEELSQLNPDIIFLQELDEYNVKYVKEFAKNNEFKICYQKKNSQNKFDGNAILYKAKNFMKIRNYYMDTKIMNNQEYGQDNALS